MSGSWQKDLVLIILTCVIWGSYLSRRHNNFQCDNANLVTAINKSLSKDKFVIHLLRFLSFFVAHLDIYLTTHLLEVINITANHLLWGTSHQAFQATPDLAPEPTVITPSALLAITFISES